MMVMVVRSSLVKEDSTFNRPKENISHQHAICLARSDIAAHDFFLSLFIPDLALELGDQVLAPKWPA